MSTIFLHTVGTILHTSLVHFPMWLEIHFSAYCSFTTPRQWWDNLRVIVKEGVVKDGSQVGVVKGALCNEHDVAAHLRLGSQVDNAVDSHIGDALSDARVEIRVDGMLLLTTAPCQHSRTSNWDNSPTHQNVLAFQTETILPNNVPFCQPKCVGISN